MTLAGPTKSYFAGYLPTKVTKARINGANNCNEPELVKLPITTWSLLRRRRKAISSQYTPRVFYTMWRDRISKGLLKMGKRDLPVATKILTS